MTGRKRTVALTGRGLPIGPFSVEGEQRVKVTNPPGNPEGWATVMGPTEGTTDISGYWKDKFIGDTRQGQRSSIEMIQPYQGSPSAAASSMDIRASGTQVTSAVDATLLFDSIRREGQLLQVTWGYISRRGYLKKFGQKWHNIHDCEWSATFAWVSQNLPTSSPLYGPPAGMMETGGALRELLRLISRILDTPHAILGPAMEGFRNTVNRIDSFSRAFDDSVSGFASDVSELLNVGSTLQTSLGGIASSAQLIKDMVEDQGWPLLFTDPQSILPFGGPSASLAEERTADALAIAALESIDPERVIRMQLYVRETITDARRLRDEAVIRQRALDTPTAQILDTYRAREGEDLRDVSSRYYGNPTQWRALMTWNELDTTELYAGQLLIIPNLGISPDEQG